MDSKRATWAKAGLAAVVAFAASTTVGCGGARTARFPLRDAMWSDADMVPYSADCKPDPKKPKHQICAPDEYESPFAWDGANSMALRPIARFFAVDPGGESVNVNALDEVPDSSWFTNRIGIRPMSTEEVTRGACDDKVLNPDDPDGAWVIDQGKENGANPGFRVNVPGVGKFLLKADEAGHPERATGATAIATRFYHAAGYSTGCDSIVYVRKSILKLTPGLKFSDNSGKERPFAQEQLDKVLKSAAQRNGLYRLVASKWLPGRTIGPFTYEGVRADDPNDVIPHEDRRELRGQRLLAAWLGHFDSREQNSMNTWVSRDPADHDSSPGYIRHWILDLNDCFGSEWTWDSISRRLNFSYYFDGADVGQDFITLGIPVRPWDKVQRSPEGDIFGYFEAEQFDPEGWKGGYQNPSFMRMTERDGAWMARILARMTPAEVEAAVKVGDFTQPKHTAYLLKTLLQRQAKILRRYFARLSPVTDLRVNGGQLCGLDLARSAHVYDDARFAYSATVRSGQELAQTQSAEAAPSEGGVVCVNLPRIAGDGGERDDSPSRYLVVDLRNGQAEGALHAHLYDLGPAKGYRLVGVER